MINIKIFKVTNPKLKKYLPHIVAVFFLAAAGYLGYDYFKTHKELSKYVEDSDVLAIKEKNDLMERLNEIAVLPEGEEPTIATVTDAFRLRGQKFFAQAENDDKVIIFANAKRAILYRPSTGKIVESAPVSIPDVENSVNRGASASAETPESTSSSYVLGNSQNNALVEDQSDVALEVVMPASLAIYNGTLYIEGLANKVGAFLVKEMPGNQISVDILDNANKINEDTIIIDLTEKYKDLASDIAGLLGGEVVEKPEGVDYPEVDIIIIAGKDLEERDLE